MEVNNLLKEVRLKIAKGDFEAAKALLFDESTEHANANADNPEAQALKARILGLTDGFEKAQSMFFDLESVWPSNFNLFKMHCKFLQEFGNYNDAIALGKNILNKFANNPEAYELQIENCELAGNTEEAWKICAKAIDTFPDDYRFLSKKEAISPVLNEDYLVDEAIEGIKDEMTVKHISATNENVYMLLSLFKGRRGVHAVQTKMGKSWGYLPNRRDLLEDDIRAHLSGDKTLGIYLTDINNTSSLMVFDLDVRKQYMKNYAQSHEERARINDLLAESCKKMCDLCSASGLQPMVEKSGNKGLHFWFFSAEPIACKYWRALGNWFFRRLNFYPDELSWELFPKQDKVAEDGLGNLVKLPLGTHRKTGKLSLFVDQTTFDPFPDQIEILKNTPKIDRAQFESILGAITVDNCVSDAAPLKSAAPKAEVQRTENEVARGEQVDDSEFKISVKIPLPERNTMEVEQLLIGCKPMWLIMEKAKNEHRLEENEKHAFIYIFAHLGDEGKVFVHQVMNQLEDYQPDLINTMIKAVPPNPSGCAKIRRHIPEYCGSENCNCQFRLPQGSYQSPVIHAGIFPNKGNFTQSATLRQPANLSGNTIVGGESGGIDKLMQEYAELNMQIERIRERGAILRRQINKIFNDAGTDVIETRIRVYHKLPDSEEPFKLLQSK